MRPVIRAPHPIRPYGIIGYLLKVAVKLNSWTAGQVFGPPRGYESSTHTIGATISMDFVYILDVSEMSE